jgi:pyruvate dehydrogenase E1 component beta subunit
MTVMNMVQAINSALASEMEADDSVIILGEDVGRAGGVFRVTDGLFERFGGDRVIDTPLAESLIAGMATGMAMAGLRPVAEMQFMGFSYLALSMIISHTARMRNRSRGSYTVPMVMRMPYGAGVKALEHHSESTESLYVQIPGLKVVVPSTPREAKGLLISSIRDPDPVVFLEPTRSYRLFKEEVEDGSFTIPIGESRMVREGDDVTVVGWGAMMPMVQEAADASEREGTSCEIIDLRTLSPMDSEAVVRSVKKTGRVVVVQEAPMTCGVAGELISRLTSKAFLSLEAPPERVTAPDITVPLPQGEKYYYISPDRIYNAIRRAASF